MSRISTSAPLLLMAFVLLGGCKHRPQIDEYSTDNMYHWMSWYVYESKAKLSVFGKQRLREIVFDKEEEDAWRRLAVFDVFEDQVRPGWRSRDFGTLFKDPSWINGAQITPVFGVGGFIAVDLHDKETDLVFTFIPFAENRGDADTGGIDICLGGLNKQFGFTNEAEAVALAKAFLRGDLESNEVYLIEFAMSHPDRLSGCIQRFTKRGHGLMPWR